MRGHVADTPLAIEPRLVTRGEVFDPQCLDTRCSVHGVILPRATAAQLNLGAAEPIGVIGRSRLLETGDVVTTGTSSGVGFTRIPSNVLGEGDEVRVAMHGMGFPTNPAGLG
jgi:2-keto-4-pentenoate hydratase/2-oxohepta-3-ene-1,7-dioic acid hydratase in catechol pathway